MSILPTQLHQILNRALRQFPNSKVWAKGQPAELREYLQTVLDAEGTPGRFDFLPVHIIPWLLDPKRACPAYSWIAMEAIEFMMPTPPDSLPNNLRITEADIKELVSQAKIHFPTLGVEWGYHDPADLQDQLVVQLCNPRVPCNRVLEYRIAHGLPESDIGYLSRLIQSLCQNHTSKMSANANAALLWMETHAVEIALTYAQGEA
jgi:hypothetical protein